MYKKVLNKKLKYFLSSYFLSSRYVLLTVYVLRLSQDYSVAASWDVVLSTLITGYTIREPLPSPHLCVASASAKDSIGFDKIGVYCIATGIEKGVDNEKEEYPGEFLWEKERGEN